MTEILSIILPVLSAVLAASMTYFAQRDLTNRSQLRVREEKDRETLLERGEELYSLAHRWQRHAGADFLMVRQVMQGAIDYNQAFDAIIENGRNNKVDFDRINLILRVYFPSLRGRFEKIHQKILLASEIEINYRQNYKNGKFNSAEHLPLYEEIMISTEGLIDTFLDNLAVELRKRLVFNLS